MNIICGQGRLGARITARLAQRGAVLASARLDAVSGLRLADEDLGHLQAVVNCLLVCMVPKTIDVEHSPWRTAYDGLIEQVQRGDVRIDRIVHVSSTAVYESIHAGWITSGTPCSAHSERALGLIEAEEKLSLISQNRVSVRLPGLTGAEYARYRPLELCREQTRHAVDVEAAASAIADIVLMRSVGESTELITDGLVYWQGRAYPVRGDNLLLESLSLQQKILRPSIIAGAA